MYQGKEKKQLEQHPNKGKMVNMTIDESVHRREIEKSVVKHSKNLAIWGMGFAFSSVLVISSLCFYAFQNNFPNQAATIATGVIVALAGVFLFRKPNKDKSEK
jgi:uncharacterized membrane protein